MPQPRLCRAVTQQPPRLESSSFPVPSPAFGIVPAAWRSRRSRSLLWVGVAALLLIDGSIAHAGPVATKQQNVATSVDRFATVISEASQRFGIPASWIRAVIQVESLGEVRALSSKGAMGLMQIMPEAWAALRSRYELGADPYDAHDNILAGAGYLRELHDRYGSPGFLAAYNAGPARYEDHLASGRALPAETRAYVTALAPLIGGASVDRTVIVEAVVRLWTEAPLFALHHESGGMKSPMSSDSRSSQRLAGQAADDWATLVPQSQGLFVSTSQGNWSP